MRRRVAALFVIAALILLLIDLPSRQVTISIPPVPPPTPGPPQGPSIPPASGVCDSTWSAPGFRFRFMVYDKVVHREPRFGPEVEGRSLSEVMQELTERLCTDDALLVDLTDYHEFGFRPAPSVRPFTIADVAGRSKAWRQDAVEQLLEEIAAGLPRLEKSRAAYTTKYYQAGSSSRDIPRLRGDASGPALSDFLVYTTGSGDRRLLRLQCGFQPMHFLSR